MASLFDPSRVLLILKVKRLAIDKDSAKIETRGQKPF